MENIITRLRSLQVRLSLDGNGKLKVHAPSGTLSMEILEEIKQHKEYLIDYIGGVTEKQRFSLIERAADKKYYAISSAQKRLYFLYQLDRDSLAYNMPQVIKIDGKVDRQQLDQVFGTLVNRHESFRTSFEMVDGGPLQKIWEKVDFRVRYSEAGGRTEEAMMEEFVRPFDLGNAPLLRVEVVSTTADQYLLLVDTHHIIADGVSLEVLSREFHELYAGRPLPPLRIQYKDYAEWQNGGARSGKAAEHTAWWQQNLSGALPVLHLPLDYQRLAADSDKGAGVNSFLRPDEMKLLKRCAAEHNMTTSMFLYALLGVLFSRLSGDEDIIIGLSIAGRNHPDLERVVGMFVNALPIRCFPQKGKSLGVYLKEVKTATLMAYDHQDCQFDYLVEKLGGRRETGRNPIFDVMLNMVGKIDGNFDLSDGVSGRYTHSKLSKRFDLTLNVIEYNNTLWLQFQYDAALFSAGSIELFLRYFRNLLAAAAGGTDTLLIDLPLETEEKKAGVWSRLESWSWAYAFDNDNIPASWHQERLWFIDRFESGFLYEEGPLYHNIPLIIDWEGPLDRARLEKCIRTVIAKHEILRTSIVTVGEQPFQRLLPLPDVMLPLHDVNADDPQQLIQKEIDTPFRLDGQLFRVALLRPGEDRYTLVMVFHHSIADRYSVKKLTEEIVEAYRSRSNEVGAGPEDKPPVLQYGAFSAWQREALSQLDPWFLSWWRLQLGGNLAALELPEDRQRAAIHVYTAADADISIPEELTAGITAYGREHGVDTRTILMAAFKILLAKYCRQEEIVIGTSIDYRETPLLRTMIGPAANLVVLRSFITPETSFADVVRTIRHDYERSVAYGHIPFDQLVKKLAPKKDMSRTALFDVLFQFEETGTIGLDGVKLGIRETNRGYGKYDLNVLLQQKEGVISGKLVYNADYFDRWRMESLLRHYYKLIGNLLAAPRRQLATVSMVGRQEQQLLLQQFDNTAVGYPLTETIIDLFDRQVMLRGDKQAIRLGREALSYRQLDRKVNRLAVLLREKGVRPNTIVGLLMDRSIDTVAGMLAILKAGGAYLPIDTDYPQERIDYLLADSGAALVLTTEAHQAKAGDVPVVLTGEAENRPDTGAPEPVNAPEDICYVIYTSGTTGHPKGVMVQHRNVVRLFVNDRFAFDFGPDDVWTLFHSHCFDFSVWEMYGALLFGGTLIVIPKMVARDTRQYLTILQREKVTILNQTPGAFYALIREELSDPGSRLPLRYVIFGGEALSPGKLKEWRALYPAVKLINMFGITETTVHVTYKEIGNHEIEHNISNIGKPIPTLSVCLLDEYGNPVPNGIPGELYVGGAGVAKGYLNKEALTAARFVPDPFKPHEKLYRSGDLARVLASGELEYIGRIDHQVKVRGFRIELGEIENQLLTQGSIRDVIVLAREKEGETFLVAWYVAEKENPGLRKFLLDRLPEHMVPAYFVHLRTMPLTSNGKVDRKALPDPDSGIDEGYTAPVNETEEKLAAIWADILRLDRAKIGTNRSFFELGGHSLKAAVLVSRINKELQVNIALKDIFTYQDIQHQSRLILQADTSRFTAIAKAIAAPAYKLSSAQKRMYFLYEFDKTSLAYNMPQVVRLVGEPDRDKITAAFRALVARHEAFRTSFRHADNEVCQYVSDEALLEVDYFVTEETGIPSVIQNFIRPFDLGKAPLIRVGLAKSVHRDHILMVDMHHIIGDGVSQAILIRDFLRLYNGESPAPLSLQYKDYAEWQQGPEQQVQLARQRKFWHDAFAGEPPVLDLPADFLRPAVKQYEGATRGFLIGMKETDQLKAMAAAENCTLFMVLLSVFNVLLGKLGNTEDVVVGTPVAGRHHADLEKMIGMFVSTLPLRHYPCGDHSWHDFLASVKENALAAFDRQAYPYETLVEELGLARDAGRNPLFDTLFTMPNFEETEFTLPGITLKPYARQHAIAKFDLSLTAHESDGHLELFFEYATALFRQDTIDRFIRYFKRIVSAVLTDSAVRLADIDILCAEEEFRLLQQFNDTAKAYPRNRTLVQLFEDQVQRSPGRQALVRGDESRTYRELNEAANRLALLLKAKGLRQNECVGVWADRSFDAIVAIIGILKAGGAYLPLDINYPADRLHYMFADAGLRFLVTETGRACPVEGEWEIIPLESAAIMPAGGCERSTGAEDIAYVMYTSGSTGHPKGVMVSHRNVIRLVKKIDWLPLNEETRILQTGALSFDASTLEIWGSLLNGGTLFLSDNETLLNTHSLGAALGKHRINTLWLTASLFDQHAQENPGIFKPLRYLLAGGDVLNPSMVGRVMDCHPGLTMINGYGPTENTTFSACHAIGRPSGAGIPTGAGIATGAGIPIGRPINNSTAYIFDQYRRLLPQGVVGELYVGGDGVALGYFNHAALTEQRFLLNPYKPGERLYRTGDLARWLPEGVLEFKGRADQQVKIRGFRIEPAEIERWVAAHEAVSRAAVIAKEGKTGKYLVAYYLSEKEISAGEWRIFLARHLPEYMLPAYFVRLESFPLTPNGKLDRNALPDHTIAAENDYIAPATVEEELLAAVWGKVLGLEKVGVQQNFFSAGGDSIKSIQIISRLRNAGYAITVKDIFTDQTIRQLAGRLKPLGAVADQSPVTGVAVLTPIQRWFADGPIRAKHHYNQSVLLDFSEGITAVETRIIFAKLQHHHDALRMVYRSRERMMENRSPDAPVSLLEMDLTADPDAAAALSAACRRLQAGIDLADGPLIKLGLFHLPVGSRLLIVIHHLVVDGISWRILFEDIDTLYRQHKNNEPLTLPLKTDPFLSWAGRLAQYKTTAAFFTTRGYWQDQLAGPWFFPEKKPAAESGLAPMPATATFTLGKEATTQLLGPVHRAFGTQINDILLTAFLLGMTKQYGRHPVRIDLEGHGREPVLPGVDVSRTVGWFTSIYPVVLAGPGADLREAIRSVKETLRRVPNKGIDFLLHDLAAGRSAICFNYLGQFDSDTNGNVYSISAEDKGEAVSPEETREYDWEITGMVAGGQLGMGLSYNRRSFDPAVIESLMQACRASLLELIGYCSGRPSPELTPSDLTWKGLSIDTFDRLNARWAVKDVYPLSPMQEGMLFHSLLDPQSDFYFEQMTYRLEGFLDIPVVERAIQGLIERYDVLRTAFLSEGVDRPLQVVLKERKADFVYKDIIDEVTALTEETAVDAYRQKDKARKFDLAVDPLMRLTVLRTGSETWCFIWSFHHVIMDGWCLSILINEFSALCAAASGASVNLPPAEPYARYIEWLESRDPSIAESYWKVYLAGYDRQASWPKRAPVTTAPYLPRAHSLNIDPRRTKALQHICRNNGVTINTLLQTVWGILLGRYNGATDVVFGAVVSGRPSEIEGIEAMVGLFINTIPVRIRYEDDPAFDQLIRNVQANAIESEPHHYYPLTESQALSQPGRGLLDHILVFENYPIADEIERDGDEKENYRIVGFKATELTNYDLSVVIAPGAAIGIKLDYNAAVYDDDMIQRISTHLLRLLDQVVRNEKIKLSGLRLLSEAEEGWLDEGNGTEEKLLEGETVLSLIGRQAGEAVAMECEGVRLSYGQLQRLSSGIGAWLRETAGVQRGDRVGLLMGRDIYLAAALLGIWKAGAAYVPVDPSYPQERIDAILGDAEVKYVLTAEGVQKAIRQTRERVLPADETPGQGDLAYVLFTSGSTGRPKGVMISHRSLVNYVGWAKESYHRGEAAVYPLFTSVSFDLTLTSIFAPLVSGGKVVVYGEEEMGGLLQRIFRNKELNSIKLTPTHLRIIRDLGLSRRTDAAGIRTWVVGGEDLEAELAGSITRLFGEDTVLYNEYGPTEATVGCMIYRYRGTEEGASVPIGRPARNTQLYLLDGNGQRVPVGVEGELYIGGEGLAQGYLNREALTAERFRSDPHRGRLYRTGDLAVLKADGEMVYRGRKDAQVKLRGYRIEPGEISSRLSGQGSAGESVVVVREVGGERSLVGYYTGTAEASELRSYLQSRLPEYMVPAYWRRIERLPVTANGKLDERLLPAIERGGDEGYEAPVNATGEQLVAIWAELLRLEKEKISTNKSFFELGGHSLKAIQLTSQISKQFSVKIALIDFFKDPTINYLATTILGDGRDYRHQAIPPAPVRADYPLSFPQRRLYLLHQLDLASVAYNMPYTVRLEDELDVHYLQEMFRQLIRRHESLRTSFHLVEGQPVQRIAADAPFDLVVYDRPNPEPEELIRAFIRPFDPGQAPLMRAALIKETSTNAILVVDMHHIISDGVSQQLLMEDFQSFYRGEQPPPLPIQYKDYAWWQQSEAQLTDSRRQQAFWLQRFQLLPDTLMLPTDYPRSPVKRYEGGMVQLRLSPRQVRTLKQMAEYQGCTLFTILLSAYSILLSKLSGSEDIVIGTSTAGRQHADLQNVMGMFVNTLPLRTFPKGDSTFAEFLDAVQLDSVSCLDHQSYPYEELIDQLGLERDFSRNPLFDVMFSYQSLESTGEAMPGLLVTSYESDHRVSKFDLTLAVNEGEGHVHLGFEYATDLFTEETIERFAGYYGRILSAMAADPGGLLSDTGLLSEAEEGWLDEGNGTEEKLLEGETVLSLIGRQAGEAVAMECEGVRLSYGQLQRLSSGIGAWLRETAGVQRGDRVGLLMGRDIYLAAALLGIWKAGAAYVPVDPSYPQERIDAILGDAEVKYVLTAEGVQKAIRQTRERVLPADETPGQGDLAYVLFTSGSTGRPKGVMISHRSLVNYVGWAKESYHRGEAAVYPLFTSVSFDLTLTSIFAPLVSGGKVVVYGEEEMGGLLQRIFRNKELNSIKLTPTHLRIIRDLGLSRRTDAAGIRTWVVGGEDLEAELAGSIKRLFGEDSVLYNEYGPTEATVGCMIYRYRGTEEGASVPIGRPARNTQLYLLDGNGQRVPVGVEGELYIGGEGLAQGYLNREALTAERFRSDPHRGRLYRTGDLAVLKADGEMVYRGRKDAQVKLRGYRIEPGEISSRLSGQGSAGESVVVVREVGGERSLVGYYTGTAEASELRSYLQSRLPEYMVPAYWRRIERLPVTANGKLDERLLPAIERGGDEGYEAPVNATGEQLVAIWAELLRLEKEKISTNKSFFELGGNSLKVIHLNALVNKTFGWNIPVAVMFRYPTISSLIRYVREGGENPDVYKQEAGNELADMENMLDILNNTNPSEYEQF